MITPVRSSSLATVKACWSSKRVWGRNALRTSGRLIVIFAIPSEVSYLMSVYSPAGTHSAPGLIVVVATSGCASPMEAHPNVRVRGVCAEGALRGGNSARAPPARRPRTAPTGCSSLRLRPMSPSALSAHSWPCAVEPDLLQALSHALYDGGPAVTIIPHGPEQALISGAVQPTRPLERDDVALVMPTSGSTGRPKGVLLPAAALLASARLTHDRLGGTGQWLLALPPTHIAGVQVLVRSIVAGEQPVVLDLSRGFDPAAFAAGSQALTGDRRYTALVPTQLRRLLDRGETMLAALRSYDAILVGGSAVPA